MKLIQFKQFEIAKDLLENNAPEEVSVDSLNESGLTVEDLVLINEGLLGDIIGGAWKGLKTKILQKIPGSTLRKVDEIIKSYKKEKMQEVKDIMVKMKDMYTMSLEVEESPEDKGLEKRFKELKNRSDKAAEIIKNANKSKMEAFATKLELIKKGKNSFTTDYIEFALAQVKEDVANQQLKDAKKLASEDVLKGIEEDVKKAKIAKDTAAKAMQDDEDAKKKDKEEKDKAEKEIEDKKKNDPKNAKVGQEWEYTKKSGDTNQGKIKKINGDMLTIATENARAGFGVERKSLTKLIKDVEEKK